MKGRAEEGGEQAGRRAMKRGGRKQEEMCVMERGTDGKRQSREYRRHLTFQINSGL